ncbi:MAG: cytochrome C [Gammaproteobacteria bacterium]|uniref:Vgb family protein n=1 Tax=Pseudomaricurvus alcaniphilus TaxID=1166482 RepID=UPI00140C59F9|nr:cytochrome C [Pseudomaricurvus alcaniphilus]MBR9910913.1 cytochrome C [Gammaproteobacteria bacterium]NHN37185.1 cytochrome C [Pseudomaricurvus alcaniphilus]
MAQQSTSLPEGPGKALVETVCTACHSAATISRSAGFSSAAEWRRVFSTMVNLGDAQAGTIANYLAEHFPEDPARRPTLVPGPVEIEITEWTTPTLGQRTRDPIEAPDGSIWWTGMWASLVGRLDPNTGAMKEYPLPPSARPHSIVPDEQGNIWYTGNSNATLGKLDPNTGDITEYKTRAQDPHTAVFHPNGQLYFTAQRAAVLGRFNPATKELKEVATEARPYGIKAGPDGTLWVAYNGTNKIGAMNPDTMEIRYYELPDRRTRVRRLDLDSQGDIWYVNSSMGKIGRLQPDTGKITEWDSPSGPKSHPYALAVIDDVVWYNESGMRPDALVRFDPKIETFQSWAIPSGVGIVRHVWVTKAGNLLIHQSSTNKVGLVKIQ